MKVLCVDIDPQGSLTHILQGDGNKPGAYEIMKGLPAAQVIQGREGLPDIIPTNLLLAGADAEYSGKLGRDFFLKKALEPLAGEYALVVLDTPPTLGTLLWFRRTPLPCRASSSLWTRSAKSNNIAIRA